jgi:hypothetical protein
LDGDSEKLTKYPDPLNTVSGARYEAVKHRLDAWKCMTARERKIDEILVLIKQGIKELIQRLTDRPFCYDEILIADSSNESKWSIHVILPRFFVNGASKVRKFTDDLLQLDFCQHLRASGILDEGVNKDYQSFRMAESHKISDPSRVKKIKSSHSWRDSLITFIEAGAVELYPYLDENASITTAKVKVAPSVKEQNRVVKLVEERYPFLVFRGKVNGRDDYNRQYSSLCDVCNTGAEHSSENMYGVWRNGSYFLHCYRASDTAEPIKIFEMKGIATKKAKLPSKMELLSSRLDSPASMDVAFSRVAGSSQIYNNGTMRSYGLQRLLGGKRHLVLVKAHCGVGKSIQLSEELQGLKAKDGSPASVLILSGRRSLAHGQKALFEGFELYLDRSSISFSPSQHPRLIISPESLHKIEATGYDVIVLDEFETITQNFSGPTMRKPALCHDTYKSLLRDASLVLALDASLDSSSLVHLQELAQINPENSSVHWNQYLREDREARFYITNNVWNAELLGSLEKGLKVYIPMFSSPETALALHRKLGDLGYRGKCFTRRLGEDEKKEIFGDINGAVDGLDYLIATPVMTCGVNITVANFDVAFAHFCTNAGISFHNAYQMLHRVRVLHKKRVHILTDLRSDKLPVNREDLLAFISYRCNYVKFPELEEAHCDRVLTNDGRWVLKPSPSLETHLYNASRMNLSRNDFVGCLGNILRESGYTILNGESVSPLFPGRTPNKDGAELRASVRDNKRELDDERCRALAGAPILTPEQKAEISIALENEVSIDETDRLALQKSNLASFYSIDPEEITESFAKNYAAPEIKKAYTALQLSLLSQEELHDKHRESVIRDPREKASCTSILPHVQALDEILRGLGFSAGIFTTQPISRKVFEVSLQAFVPTFKANERRYYAAFGKRMNPHSYYNLNYFVRFLKGPLSILKTRLSTKSCKGSRVQSLSLIINKKLTKILPVLPISAVPETLPLPTPSTIPKSLTISNSSEIDELLALIQKVWNPHPDSFQLWNFGLHQELQNCQDYFAEVRRSCSSAAEFVRRKSSLEENIPRVKRMQRNETLASSITITYAITPDPPVLPASSVHTIS